MIINDRDILVFKTLHKYKLLGTSDIEALVFRSSTTSRRLKKLVIENYLGCKSLTDTNTGLKRENIYFLKELAYNHLPYKYRRQSIPKAKNLSHTLDTNSCRIKIESAMSKHTHIQLKEYKTERETNVLSDGKVVKIIYDKYFSTRLNRSVSIRPDSIFILQLTGDHKYAVYFVEIDRSTEKHSVISKKIKFYWDYFHQVEGSSKRYMKKYNVNIDFFRVLFITTSNRRIKHLMKGLSFEEGLGLFFFTTFELLQSCHNLSEPIFLNSIKGEISLVRSQ
jgi:hypothetical protein